MDDRPLWSYTGLMAAFGALFAGLLALTRGRLPQRVSARDVVLGGVATHKISRLLAKDKVTQPLRAPFTKNPTQAGPSEVDEEPAGEGPRKAIGELVSCPYCLGMWVATGLLYGFLLVPRFTRLVAAIFSAHAIADFLQVAYKQSQD